MRLHLFALAAVLSISGCDQKKPATSAPPPALKLTDADMAKAEELADRIVDAAHEEDIPKLVAVQDFDALWEELIRDLNAPKSFLTGAKSGFLGSIKTKGGLLAAFSGKPVVFLRAHEREGESVLLFRSLEEGGGAVYADFFLKRSAAGDFSVRDVYSYALGERTSTLMKRILAQSAAGQTKSPLASMFGGAKSGWKGPDVEKAFGLHKLLAAGKHKEILDVSATLPAELRNERFVLFMRVQAAMALGDDAVYLSVLDELAAAFPKDPSVDFALLDRHFLKKDYAKALKSVDGLVEQMGSDAFLATLQGACLIELKRFDEAKAVIEEGAKLEPDHSGVRLKMVDLLAVRKDFAGVRKHLEEIYDEFNLIMPPKTAAETGLTEFYASPEGKTHTEFLKKLGELK